MEIKIQFQICLLISIIQLVNCRLLIERIDHRFKRSTFNDSLPVSTNQTSHLNFSDFVHFKLQNADRQVQFTTPRISTDKWIPLLNNKNNPFTINDLKSLENSDLKINNEEQIGSAPNNHSKISDDRKMNSNQFIKNDHKVKIDKKDKINESAKSDKFVKFAKLNNDSLIENSHLFGRRIDEGVDRGLIRVEKFDPILTSTSDNLMVKNYSGYKSNESAIKREPQVQYDEHEALSNLNEIEKRLRNQLEQLENQRKMFNQQYSTMSTYPTNIPTTQYENASNSFRSMADDNSLNQDAYAKSNLNPTQTNQFNNYQTNMPSNEYSRGKLNHQANQPVKSAEVLYLDKEDSEIANSIGDQQSARKPNSSSQVNYLTYQPPIPTFAINQPVDEYSQVYDHLKSPGSSNQEEFSNFRNNQLQPYLYKATMKSSLTTATPLSYSSSTVDPTNLINHYESLNPISFQPKPTEYSTISSEIHKSPAYYSTTRSTIPFNLRAPITYPASSIQNKTMQLPNEQFKSIYNVPNLANLSSKIIESNSHMSQLNPQYVQNSKKSVAYLDQRQKIKQEYDLKHESDSNPYLTGEDRNRNYMGIPNVRSAPVTYRNQYGNSPTISPGLIHTSSSLSSPNELNDKLSDNTPVHVIKTRPVASNGDYVKVYDEKTNEWYYIKSNDFNQLKTTEQKLDLLDIRRPNKEHHESSGSEATRELLKAVEAVIKVKPKFKHYATRAVSDLASKLKDHIKSFTSSAGTYASYPYTDLSEFNYEMKRDPVYGQHFDEYTGKVLSGSVDKESIFNHLRGEYAKPDFISDSDHLNIIEPISLNSDRNTVKQNMTLFSGNSSIMDYPMNTMNRQMAIKSNISNIRTTNFISKQKIDYFNRLIDEQKRSNQRKQFIQQQLPTLEPIQSNPPNTSANAKPSQTTRYVTRIAIKQNRPPVVQHFKYIHSVNQLQPVNLNEKSFQTVNYRQFVNHDEHSPNPTLNMPTRPDYPTIINEEPFYYPMELSRNYHPINNQMSHFINNQVNIPRNHPVNHPISTPLPKYYDQTINHRQENDQSMIVQETKQFATYTTQSTKNLTDHSLLPNSNLLRLNSTDKNNTTESSSRGLSKAVLVRETVQPVRDQRKTLTRVVTNKIILPEKNFEYNPRFSSIKGTKNGREMMNSRRKIVSKNSGKNSVSDDYLSGSDESYSNLGNILDQNLLQQLFGHNDATSINTSNSSLLSFEPTFREYDKFDPSSMTPYPSITSSPDSTIPNSWLFRTVDQMIDVPNVLSSNPLVASNAQMSNSHLSMNYNPQLIAIASLLHQSSLDDHLSNSLPFDYSSINSPNDLFVASKNNANSNQIYQSSAVTSNKKKSGQESRNSQINQSANNLNTKLDHKLTIQAPAFEFLSPIKSKLQKFYRNLVDGQQKRSRVTINVLNNRQASTTPVDYEPMYRAMEFDEQNLKEILNGDEDAELLASLLEDEQADKRNGLNNLKGFNKRTLDTESPVVDQQMNESKQRIRQSILEELLRRFYEKSNDLHKLSNLKSIELNSNQTDSSLYSSQNTNNSIDSLTGQSTNDLADSTNQPNNWTYRHLIDHSQSEQNANRLTINNQSEQANGVQSIIDMNEGESKKVELKKLLFKLFRLKDQIPEEKTMREKTQIEVYEREHLFDSSNEAASNQTIPSTTKSPIELLRNESRKVNYYPSATWFVPTIVYDQLENHTNKIAINKNHVENRFEMRKKFQIDDQSRLDHPNKKSSNERRNRKIFKSTDESNLIENKAADRPVARDQHSTIATKLNSTTVTLVNSNKTKSGLLKTKEKGFKIITEFELVHKDLPINGSNREANQTAFQPSFRMHVVDNELEGSEMIPTNRTNNQNSHSEIKSKFNDPINSLDESVQQSWNNKEYLNDVRKQIRKELPDIDTYELEKIVEQFQTQDAVHVTESFDELKQQMLESALNKKMDDQNKVTKSTGFRKSMKKRPTNKKFSFGTKIDSHQSRPVAVHFPSDFTNETDSIGSSLKDRNKTMIEDDELNSKMLNRINDLLEQQFKSLKDELKANRSSDNQSTENTFKFSTVDTKMLIDLSPELNSESNQIKTKFKSSYIPESAYHIERDGNGVRRVKQKPVVGNILARKKFMDAFKSQAAPNNEHKFDKVVEDEQKVPSNRQILKKKHKSEIDLENEMNRLNMGDHDWLY